MTSQEIRRLKDDTFLKAIVLLKMIDNKTDSSTETYNRLQAYFWLHQAACLELQAKNDVPVGTPIQGGEILQRCVDRLAKFLADPNTPVSLVVACHAELSMLLQGGAS